MKKRPPNVQLALTLKRDLISTTARIIYLFVAPPLKKFTKPPNVITSLTFFLTSISFTSNYISHESFIINQSSFITLIKALSLAKAYKAVKLAVLCSLLNVERIFKLANCLKRNFYEKALQKARFNNIRRILRKLYLNVYP